MRLLVVSLVISSGLWATPARGDQVLSRASYWNSSGTRIFTDVTVRRDDGSVETVTVPGGKVGDVGMVQIPLGVEPGPLAYVRTRTASGTPLRWAKSCVFVEIDPEGTTDVDGELELSVIEDVFQHWEQSTASCGYLQFVVERRGGEVGFDKRNRIKFREESWCRPATKDDPEECYPAQAAALTTLFFVDRPGGPDDGTILDGDIELNAVNFAVSVGGNTNGQGSLSDLANTLTHEVGHLVGLDHTCWDGRGTRPTNHLGEPVPDCFPEAELPQEVKDATMYNFQDPGETKKATLEADDINGFCSIYPVADDPGKCEPAVVDKSGCLSVAGGAGGEKGGVLLLVSALALLLLRRGRCYKTSL